MRMDHYNSSLKSFLAGNAEICLEELSNCPYLKVIKPCGALYVMVEILVDSIDFGRMNGSNDSVTENKDVLFANCLLQEQNLFILPGKCFDMPNFIRLVICPPPDVLRDALSRLKFFCEEHKK